MRSFRFIFFILALLPLSLSAQSPSVEVVKFESIDSLLSSNSGKIQVINFWATWCAPCIKELPHFEAAFAKHPDKIDLHLISLDYADQMEKVRSFAEKKSLTGNVLILDELDYDTWIDRVDPSWSGAIPATLFIIPATGQRIFVESELSAEELQQNLNELLN